MALIKIVKENSLTSPETNEKIEFEPIVGIDFGTTNSLVAIMNKEDFDQKPDQKELIKFFSSNQSSSFLHKSLVAFNLEGKVVAVGNDVAISKMNNEDLIIINSIKRFFGKSYSEAKAIAVNFSKKINIVKNNENQGFYLEIGKNKYSPEFIASQIFSYLKQIAEKQLGKTINKAVVAVPAYFDDSAKNAVKYAAEIAGLQVVRLINEPTAAAISFNINEQKPGIYIIYDLGGGTFDVSIVKMEKGVFRVLGIAGDNNLGGDDFDYNLQQFLQKKFNLTITFEEAREFKKQLSELKEVIVHNGNEQQDRQKITITQEDFVEINKELIKNTIKIVNQLLLDLDLTIENIESLLLVGGSTRIPAIKEQLATIIKQEKILTSLDPDKAVAIGATIQANQLNRTIVNKNRHLLIDVVPLSLGLEMMGGIVDKIIERNTPVPISKIKYFTTYTEKQTAIIFHIVQGEREIAKDCRSLAYFKIDNLPQLPPGIIKVAVSFSIDVDGLLKVIATEENLNIKQEIEIKPSFGLSAEIVKQELLQSLDNSKADIEARLLADLIVKINKDLEIVKGDLANLAVADKLKNKLKIAEKISEIEIALELKNRQDLSLLQAQFNDLCQELIDLKITIATIASPILSTK